MNNINFIMKKKVRHHRQVKPVAEELTVLEQKQKTLVHLVRMAARGHSHGLFVSGQGGLGKSRTIEATLKEEGSDVVLLNSHLTPLAMHSIFYANRKDKIIIIDDADSIYSNLQILGLLRSALWGNPRVITYNSTHLKDAPSSFVFESRIIFCANCIPTRNEAFKAILSRVDCFELEVQQDEIFEFMEKLASRGYESLSPAECLSVVEHIRNADGDRQISMRLYEPALRKVIYCKEHGLDWKPLVDTQLNQIGQRRVHGPAQVQKADEKEVMKQALAKFSKSSDQQDYWITTTKRSRASFFRVKKQVQSQNGNHCQSREAQDE